MVGWKCSLFTEPLTPPQGSGCHRTLVEPHLRFKSTHRNTSGQEQMSVKEAEELKVWFFRAIGLSKSHHSWEETKHSQGHIVHWWLVRVWLGSGVGLADLLLSTPAPSWHQGLNKGTVRRHTVEMKWKRGRCLFCRHSASEKPPYGLFPEWKDELLWDFQRRDIGPLRSTSQSA